jgi:hypothetical protein
LYHGFFSYAIVFEVFSLRKFGLNSLEFLKTFGLEFFMKIFFDKLQIENIIRVEIRKERQRFGLIRVTTIIDYNPKELEIWFGSQYMKGSFYLKITKNNLFSFIFKESLNDIQEIPTKLLKVKNNEIVEFVIEKENHNINFHLIEIIENHSIPSMFHIHEKKIEKNTHDLWFNLSEKILFEKDAIMKIAFLVKLYNCENFIISGKKIKLAEIYKRKCTLFESSEIYEEIKDLSILEIKKRILLYREKFYKVKTKINFNIQLGDKINNQYFVKEIQHVQMFKQKYTNLTIIPIEDENIEFTQPIYQTVLNEGFIQFSKIENNIFKITYQNPVEERRKVFRCLN